VGELSTGLSIEEEEEHGLFLSDWVVHQQL
jgi:hypothetical protein